MFRKRTLLVVGDSKILFRVLTVVEKFIFWSVDQKSFCMDFLLRKSVQAVMLLTLPVSYFHFRLFLSWRKWWEGQMFLCRYL